MSLGRPAARFPKLNPETTMLCLCRRCVCWLAVILTSAAPSPAVAGESFPVGSELVLDTHDAGNQAHPND